MMRSRVGAVACLVLCGFAMSCLSDEKTRPYEEFVSEYEAISGGESGEADMSASPDSPPDIADAGQADLPVTPDMSGPDPNNPPECSLNGTVAASVEFVNVSGQALDLYWVRPSCVPVKYVTIEAEQSYTQSTFVGHVWLVAPAFSTVVNMPERRTVIYADTTRAEVDL